ncbi:MAG: NAD-dependent epimerase/dehydratase family protein [Eubacteriales bacterium]
MRALVTGGAGFIGSHIIDALVEAGAHVAALDDLSTGRAENVRPGVLLYRMSVRDEGLDGVIASEKPDVVYHQAARVSVPASIRDPLADAGTNLLGTLNLIEACLRSGAPKIVFASSAAVYGRPAYLPLDEKHPALPLAPYGASKLAAEMYLDMYARARGLSYTVLRYANVYGPRQDALGEGGVAAVFADKLRRGERPVIFGDGGQTRDFVHVRDVAAANMLAAERGGGQVFNVGTGAGVTVNALWEEFRRTAGKIPFYKFNHHCPEPVYAPPRPGDIRHSCLLPDKARQALGWQPKVALAEGLAGLLL